MPRAATRGTKHQSTQKPTDIMFLLKTIKSCARLPCLIESFGTKCIDFASALPLGTMARPLRLVVLELLKFRSAVRITQLTQKVSSCCKAWSIFKTVRRRFDKHHRFRATFTASTGGKSPGRRHPCINSSWRSAWRLAQKWPSGVRHPQDRQGQPKQLHHPLQHKTRVAIAKRFFGLWKMLP